MSHEPLRAAGAVVTSIYAQAPAAGTVNGASLDASNYDEVLVVAAVGTILAAHTLDIKVQESADDSTFTDITNAAFSQFLPTNHRKTVLGRVKVGNSTRKRYLRAVGTSVGATAIPYAVTLIPVFDRTGDGGSYSFLV